MSYSPGGNVQPWRPDALTGLPQHPDRDDGGQGKPASAAVVVTGVLGLLGTLGAGFWLAIALTILVIGPRDEVNGSVFFGLVLAVVLGGCWWLLLLVGSPMLLRRKRFGRTLVLFGSGVAAVSVSTVTVLAINEYAHMSDSMASDIGTAFVMLGVEGVPALVTLVLAALPATRRAVR